MKIYPVQILMDNQPKGLCVKLPGEWFVGEQFDNGGYRWEISTVVSVKQGYSTFFAKKLYQLEGKDSLPSKPADS